MTLSNRMQLGLGATAAVLIAVGLVALIGPAPAPILSAPVTQVLPSAQPLANPIAPALDTFRVEPDGTTVMAGRAAPFAVVDILLNGVQIDQADADASGSFVAFAQLGYADASRAVSLRVDAKGGAVSSEETYLIAPLPRPVAVQTGSAPAVIVASTEGVRVVQPIVSDASPDVLSTVALDSITYVPGGTVQIAGRASGAGQVQVYIDNQPVTASSVTLGGDWRVALPEVDKGVYTLRIDEVDDAGAVVSRIETPFLREDPAVVAQALAVQTEADEFQVAMTTVQPGTTLWAIAQERFGDGILYVKVFEANRDRIRDPDLIYPGQVFRIPSSGE